MKKNVNNGVSLLEFLVSFSILILVTGGILYSYVRCLEFIELSKNMTMAVSAAQSKMDRIKSTLFAQVKSTFNGTSFSVSNLNGAGAVYVDDSTADLLDVYVVVCWRNKNNRLYGEDSDLDGILDSGEDLNGNLRLDSPVEFRMRIFKK